MARTHGMASILVAATGLGLAFCASAASPPPIIESQPLGADRPAERAVSGGDRLEERLARVERQLENQTLVEMLTRLEALQQEVQELRGAAELQGHRMDGIEQRQREIYIDIDRRMRQLESAREREEATPPVPSGDSGDAGEPGAAASPGATSASIAAAAGVGAAAASAAGAGTTMAALEQPDDPGSERAAYDRAFDLIRTGRYDAAINAFRAFLARYPSGAYSANAQYWLGEANYVTRRFEEAAAEFGKVVRFYPDSSKTADALLKLGFSQYEMQRWDEARQTLDRVVGEFPATTARQLAEGRLQRMRMEGH